MQLRRRRGGPRHAGWRLHVFAGYRCVAAPHLPLASRLLGPPECTRCKGPLNPAGAQKLLAELRRRRPVWQQTARDTKKLDRRGRQAHPRHTPSLHTRGAPPRSRWPPPSPKAARAPQSKNGQGPRSIARSPGRPKRRAACAPPSPPCATHQPQQAASRRCLQTTSTAATPAYPPQRHPSNQQPDGRLHVVVRRPQRLRRRARLKPHGHQLSHRLWGRRRRRRRRRRHRPPLLLLLRGARLPRRRRRRPRGAA